MNTLDKLLRIIALVSIEPILFANMFFGIMSGSWYVYFLFCLPIILIPISVFRPDKIWLGSFWSFSSAIFILLPLGLSAMITEQHYENYHEYRIFILLVLFCISTFLVIKFVKINSDKKDKKDDYFKKRLLEKQKNDNSHTLNTKNM